MDRLGLRTPSWEDTALSAGSPSLRGDTALPLGTSKSLGRPTLSAGTHNQSKQH